LNLTYQFRVSALYNGLAIMSDDRTESKWESVQGECIDGVWKGHVLETRPSLHYMTVAQAMKIYPNARIAIARPSLLRMLLNRLFLSHINSEKSYFAFPWSKGKVDTRLNAMEQGLGLGVWTNDGQCSRFYPMATIQAQNKVLIDTVGGRNILIYIDPYSGSPEAVYTRAKRAEWVQDAITLDTGEAIRHGKLFSDALSTKPERPKQLFTRWHGFSLTFPQCSIYE
jgi:hypothetical protein